MVMWADPRVCERRCGEWVGRACVRVHVEWEELPKEAWLTVVQRNKSETPGAEWWAGFWDGWNEQTFAQFGEEAS